LKDKIVLLSRFGSSQPCERVAVMLDASNFSTSNRLLGGGSNSSKDNAKIVRDTGIKFGQSSRLKDSKPINPL
jgi:hypothetical protein